MLRVREVSALTCKDVEWVCQVSGEFISSHWQFLTLTRCSQNLEKYLIEMQRFSKAIKHLYRPWRRDTHKLYTHTGTCTHILSLFLSHTHQQEGKNAHTTTYTHLKANADTQTLVHCSLKLSLCVDFSGLLNLVWGQRRCPLDSFMQCSRFSGGRRDVSNSSHEHSTIR